MIPIVRYVFIHSAEGDASPLRGSVTGQLKKIDRGVEYDFYAAAGPEDALKHVSLYCDLHPDLFTCFVACGDDALTAAVAAGLMGAGEGKTLAVFDPSGRNSLARHYEGRDFGSVLKLLTGSAVPLDMIRVNDSYAVNACTFGLEELMEDGPAKLLHSMSAVLRRSFNSIRITVDGTPLETGSVLILTMSNGCYSSGGMFLAPQAVNDDGRMDLCIVRNMPPTRLMKLLPPLVQGKLADEPALAGDLVLRKAKALRIESTREVTLSVDGVPLTDKEFNVRLIPSAIRMVVPAKNVERP